MMFPPHTASHLLECVYEAFRTTIRGHDHQVIRDEPASMEPGLITVLSDVVAPLRYPGVAVDPDEEAVTRSDEYEVPRDRGAGRDSASSLDLPQDFRLRCPSTVGRQLEEEQRSARKSATACRG